MGDSPTRRNTLEQGRAQDAYLAAKAGMKRYKKEYLSFVNDMPMLIKTNGLGAAVSFSTYKSAASRLVYEQITNWLAKDHKQLIDFSKGKLADRLTDISSTEYRAITIEVIAYLTWLRRFAKGIEKEMS